MRKMEAKFNLLLKPLWNILNREETLTSILKIIDSFSLKQIVFFTNVTIVP